MSDPDYNDTVFEENKTRKRNINKHIAGKVIRGNITSVKDWLTLPKPGKISLQGRFMNVTSKKSLYK